MLAANYIYPLNDSKDPPRTPYIMVKTAGYIIKRYDWVVTADNKQYYFLRNPFGNFSLAYTFECILKHFAHSGEDITINENPSNVTHQELVNNVFMFPEDEKSKMLLKNEIVDRRTKLFLDIDFDKANMSKGKRNKWVNDIIDYTIELIGFYHCTVYPNNGNNNIHIIWEVQMAQSEIKAFHTLIQKFREEKYPKLNIKEIIDNSVGIRTVFCYKQEKYIPDNIQNESNRLMDIKKRALERATTDEERREINLNILKQQKKDKKLTFYRFKPNYYYTTTNVNIKDKKAVAQEMAKHSIYGYAPVLKTVPPIIKVEVMWNNRFSIEWDCDKIDEICDLKQVKGDRLKWLKKEGWIISDSDSKIDIECLDETIYGKTFKFWGKEIKATNTLFKNILPLIKTSRVNTRQGWHYMLSIVKGFAFKSKREKAIYNVFDEWCSEADGYNKDNNKRIWDSTTKVIQNFKKLLKMISPIHTEKILQGLNISKFEHLLYKASKIKPSNEFECYNETVNGREGTTRSLDFLPGIELHSANMGLGKTEVTAEFCENINKMVEDGKSILMITPKITLAEDLKKRNVDFVCYKDKDENLNNFDHLIIQLESLHKLKRNYDVLILDEAHELCCQFISPHHESQHQLRVTFERIFKNATYVKMLEAFVTPLVWDFINIFKGDKEVRAYRNTFQKREDYETVFIPEGIKQHISRAIYEDKKFFVATNSTKLARNIEEYCKNPEKPIGYEGPIKSVLVWSHSGEAYKKEVIQDTQKLEECKVFIFTPSITVGVNIDNLQNKFDEGFCYFVNKCNSANSCIQMTNRVRDLTDKKLTVQIDMMKGYKLTKTKDLDNLFNSRARSQHLCLMESLPRDKKTNYTKFDTDDTWYRFLRSIIKSNNYSNNNFYSLFLSYIQQTGCKVRFETEVPNFDNMGEAKENLKGQEDEEYIKVSEICDEAYYDLMAKKDPLTKDEFMQIEVYNQISVLGTRAENIEQFKEVQEVLENIVAIRAEFEKELPSEERKTRFRMPNPKEGFDGKYQNIMNVDRHTRWSWANKLLQVLFNKTFDPDCELISYTVTKNDLCERIKDKCLHVQNVNKWNALFGKLTVLDVNDEKSIVVWVNRVLLQVLGLKLVSLKTATGKNSIKNRLNLTLVFTEKISPWIKKYDIC